MQGKVEEKEKEKENRWIVSEFALNKVQHNEWKEEEEKDKKKACWCYGVR